MATRNIQIGTTGEVYTVADLDSRELAIFEAEYPVLFGAPTSILAQIAARHKDLMKDTIGIAKAQTGSVFNGLRARGSELSWNSLQANTLGINALNSPAAAGQGVNTWLLQIAGSTNAANWEVGLVDTGLASNPIPFVVVNSGDGYNNVVNQNNVVATAAVTTALKIHEDVAALVFGFTEGRAGNQYDMVRFTHDGVAEQPLSMHPLDRLDNINQSAIMEIKPQVFAPESNILVGVQSRLGGNALNVANASELIFLGMQCGRASLLNATTYNLVQ